MIELNSKMWNELEHAYGSASDMPALLEQLREYPISNRYDDEPFFTLWSSLCHQGDCYLASYAAVPHIVSVIEQDPSKVDYNYFLLPVCIEIARTKGFGPSLPKELESAYKQSISKLAFLASKISTNEQVFVSVLSAALAVSKGQAGLAEVIIELTPDTIDDFKVWLEER